MSADCTTCIVYASLDDFEEAGIPASAVANLSLKVQQSALVRASRFADTFLRDRYTLPLRCPIDPALTLLVCWLAAYFLMMRRGFNPNQGADVTIRMGYDDAVKSLTRVANGQQQLCVAQSTPASQQPDVATSPSRGFSTPDGTDLPYVGPNNWGN
jgi:phage gp36-like protein